MLKTLTHISPSLRRSRMADAYFVRCLLRDSVDVPGLKTDFIPKADAINALVNSFTDDHCGVHVLWAPSGAGKSTFIGKVLTDLREQGKIAGCGIFQGCSLTEHPSKWLSDCLEISNPTPDLVARMSSILTDMKKPDDGPYIITIDRFDELMNETNLNHLQSLVVSLAAESVRTKSYAVLVAVSEVRNATTVLSWNQGKKIQVVGHPVSFRWNRSEVEELAIRLAKNNTDMMSDKDIDLCCLAGTPEFVFRIHSSRYESRDTFRKEADQLASQWERAPSRF